MDLCILGGMQVASNGDLASWIVPGKMVNGMGGAMDLVSSGNRVIVTMQHTAYGKPKILDRCSLPLTGSRVVDLLITEMAVFKFDYERKEPEMTLIEIAPGVSLEHVKENTGCEFKVSPDLKEF